MSETQHARFACDACGKSYSWKPALAGKKAKCKCGAVIYVPQTAPGSDDEPEDLYDLVEDDSPPPRPRAAAGATAPAAGAAGKGGQPRCPSCQSGMAPGAVICVTCGFNLKTGTRMNTAVGGGAAAASPAAGTNRAIAVPPGIRPIPRKGANYDHDQGGQKKLLMLGAAGLLLVGGLVGAFLLLRDAPASEPMLGNDAAIIAQMEEEDAIPVEQFLQKTGRIVSGMTPSQAEGYVRRFKEMGAVEVFAADRHMTRYLVMELPEDPSQRKALFDFENRWHIEMYEKTATDVGQKYLMLRLRL